MKQFRLIIVDDEPFIRTGIRDGLSGTEGVQILGECRNVFEAVHAIREGDADLVLLDIDLPDGTGFDVIRRIGAERMPSVVFVTAYDKYAIQAFEVNAVDYLLKPFDQGRLIASVQKIRARLNGAGDALARRLESLLEAREAQWPQTVVVRNGDRFDFVSVMSVDWIELRTTTQSCIAGLRAIFSAKPLLVLRVSWVRANGKLLAVAEAAGFDLLITTDKNLSYQQNLTGRVIAIVVLRKDAGR